MIIGFFLNFYNFFSKFIINDMRNTKKERPTIIYEKIDSEDNKKIEVFLN